MVWNARVSLVSLSMVCAIPLTARADTTILVPGSRDGRDACQEAADKLGETTQCARHLSKAWSIIAEELAKGGDMTVTVKLGAGTYLGDMDGGSYELPSVNNPAAHLVFEGGYDAAFTSRDPWATPTIFATTPARGGPYWKVGSKTFTRSLTIDGILWDMAASNKYDAKSNSLQKSGTSTHKYIKFNYWEMQDLTFRNNVFMNSPHLVTETLIRSANDDATITYENNIFLNNVIPIKLDSARYRHKPKRISVRNNSFLLNWSYNPDPTTGNPGALNIGSRDAAQEVVIEGNLFYGNFGGAIQIAPDNAPKVTIQKNNFVGNGLLHGNSDAEASVVISVRNSGLNPLNGLDYILDITDMVGGEGEDNVSINPGLALGLATNTRTVDASKVEVTDSWSNAVRRILGMNVDGGTVAISDYAPMQKWDPKAVVPTREEAKAYGVKTSL